MGVGSLGGLRHIFDLIKTLKYAIFEVKFEIFNKLSSRISKYCRIGLEISVALKKKLCRKILKEKDCDRVNTPTNWA